MKRWLLTFILGPRLKKLRKPLDPTFVATLKTKLEHEASTLLKEDTVSFIPYEWQTMKKYSFIYGTGLIAVAVLAYVFFPHSSLSAQEVIEKASAAYDENQTDSIYHEQRLDEHIKDDTITSSSLEELWINSTSGEILSTSSDPKNKQLTQASGTSSQGDVYEYPSVDDPSIDTNKKNWLSTFLGDKEVCKSSATDGNTTAVSILKIAAEDPSVHTVSGISFNNATGPDSNESEDLMNTSSLGQIKKIMATLNLGSDIETQYKTLEEDGVEYYVFDIPSEDQSGIHTKEFFDSNTFQLIKTETGTNDQEFDRSTYLSVEKLNSNNTVFNFADRGLTPSFSISADAPGYVINGKNGCYNPSGELMTPDAQEKLLNTVDSDAVKQWESMPGSILTTPPAPAEDTVTFENEGATMTVEAPAPTENQFLIRPTEGIITQGFHAGHSGIDFADDSETPPVMAAAAGTVSAAGTGWNGGYGNAVTIDHGNGYTTLYAHLTDFNVNVGDTVTQGQVIGTMGNTGRVYGNPGTHLHFEVTYNGEKIDPVTLIENL